MYALARGCSRFLNHATSRSCPAAFSQTLRLLATDVNSKPPKNVRISRQDRIDAMPTPFSAGHGITIQRIHPQGEGHPNRPVAVVCGWMGAKSRQLDKYNCWYHEQGIDTLSFAVGPQHVIFPKQATQQMDKVLQTVLHMKPSQIVFHHFSVGGFLFGQMLRLMSGEPDKYAQIRTLSKAQIYDSPPDFRGIAKGIGASMGISSPLRYPTQKLTELYLALTASTSGVEHRASSHAFHNNNLNVPALWFYSKSDPIANHEDCEIVIGKWRKSGIEVEECVWHDSLHIQHARRYPEKYFGTLGTFLHKAGVDLHPVEEIDGLYSTI